MGDSVDAAAELDVALLAYLAAYEDYTTCHVEMEAQLREGNLALSRARRDLSARSAIGTQALSPALFPSEIEPLIVLHEETTDSTDGTGMPAPSLRFEFCEDGARAVQRCDDDGDEPVCNDKDAEGTSVVADGGSDDAAEKETLATLERMGLDPEMRREIAAAVRDDGEDIAMACGNSLAIEHRAGDAHSRGVGAGSEYRATSSVSLSAGGLDHLKRAQFLAAMGETESERPKAQVKPSSTSLSPDCMLMSSTSPTHGR